MTVSKMGKNEPADIATAVACFASPAARQETGQLLVVEGGGPPPLEVPQASAHHAWPFPPRPTARDDGATPR
jgi:hypothetical protein